MSLRKVDIDGLHVVREGQGPALLAMHGPVGLDHFHLHSALKPLTAHFEVISYDWRGNGRSELKGARDQITVETLCADVETIRTETGHSRVVVLGHSGAASLALEYARRYPDRVRGLVLVSGTPRLDYVEMLLANIARKGTSEQAATFTQVMSATEFTDDALKDAWFDILPLYFRSYRHEHRTIWEPTVFRGAAWVQYRNSIMGALDALDWLYEIKIPALVVTGRHDIVTPLEEGGRRLAAGLPHATLAVFEESAHFPFLEEPEVFVATLMDWLSRISAGDARL